MSGDYLRLAGRLSWLLRVAGSSESALVELALPLIDGLLAMPVLMREAFLGTLGLDELKLFEAALELLASTPKSSGGET